METNQKAPINPKIEDKNSDHNVIAHKLQDTSPTEKNLDLKNHNLTVVQER
jgi:hypothetical protein